jgi:hypothetical protein
MTYALYVYSIYFVHTQEPCIITIPTNTNITTSASAATTAINDNFKVMGQEPYLESGEIERHIDAAAFNVLSFSSCTFFMCFYSC